VNDDMFSFSQFLTPLTIESTEGDPIQLCLSRGVSFALRNDAGIVSTTIDDVEGSANLSVTFNESGAVVLSAHGQWKLLKDPKALFRGIEGLSKEKKPSKLYTKVKEEGSTFALVTGVFKLSDAAKIFVANGTPSNVSLDFAGPTTKAEAYAKLVENLASNLPDGQTSQPGSTAFIVQLRKLWPWWDVDGELKDKPKKEKSKGHRTGDGSAEGTQGTQPPPKVVTTDPAPLPVGTATVPPK